MKKSLFFFHSNGSAIKDYTPPLDLSDSRNFLEDYRSFLLMFLMVLLVYRISDISPRACFSPLVHTKLGKVGSILRKISNLHRENR